MKEMTRSREQSNRFIGQYETLMMNEEESIATYLLRVDEVVNSIKGLGEEIEETIIVQKVLMSLSSRFNPKISAIEEMKDL